MDNLQIIQPFDEISARSHRTVVDKSAIAPQPIDSENKIREKKIKNIRGVDTPPIYFSDSSSDDPCTQIFGHWQKVMNHLQAKFDDKRKKAIVKALRLGFSIEQLKQAIDGCKNTPFNMGQNDRNQVYDDITLILRDAGHIERFIRNANKNADQSNCMKSNDIMAGVI